MDSVPGFHMNTEDINTGGTGLCVSVLTRSSVPCVSVFPINSTEGNVPSRYCVSFRAIHLHKMRGSCALRSCLHTPHPPRRLRPRRASAAPAAAGHTSSVSPLAGTRRATVSLRLGHATRGKERRTLPARRDALGCPRHPIHSRGAASLPMRGRLIRNVLNNIEGSFMVFHDRWPPEYV